MRRWQHGFGWLLAGRLLALLLVPLAASAHEARPAYLAVTETAPGQFSVLWRTPVLAGMRLPIVLKLPDRVKNLKDPVVSELADSLVERRWVDAGPNGLVGERIEFAGLQLTITDVLARFEMLDGRTGPSSRVLPSRGSRSRPRAGRLPWRAPISCTASSTSCSASIICCSCWRSS